MNSNPDKLASMSMDPFVQFHEWHHAAEGETFLQHLYNVKTTGRRLFGILEKPFQNSKLEEVCYKLVFLGKTGIGKTLTVSKFSGYSAGSSYFETPGIRITDVYWPIKVWDKVISFKLQCWDAGNSCMKKYNHIPLSCIDKADLIILIFSYNDGSSFHELPQLMNKHLLSNGNKPGCLVFGIRDMLKIEVSKSEIVEFEQKFNVQVLTIQNNSYIGPNEALKIAPILNTVCEQLWLRDQQFIMKQGVKV